MLAEYTPIVTAIAIKLLIAFILLGIGFKISKVISSMLGKKLEKSMSRDASFFITKLLEVLLKVAVLISLISYLGIPTTSFVAILGAAGLAIGFALQGSLGNFAGGVLILILKPFNSGDFIDGAGHTGTVKEIHIFYTKLVTLDNKVIIIPNAQLSNNSIVNYSINDTRRVDLSFGVAYKEDLNVVKNVLEDIIAQHSLILDNPGAFVRLGELGDSSINFTVRVWVKSEDYWQVHFDLIEETKKRFDKENIEIPYPHLDVTMAK